MKREINCCPLCNDLLLKDNDGTAYCVYCGLKGNEKMWVKLTQLDFDLVKTSAKYFALVHKRKNRSWLTRLFGVSWR